MSGFRKICLNTKGFNLFIGADSALLRLVVVDRSQAMCRDRQTCLLLGTFTGHKVGPVAKPSILDRPLCWLSLNIAMSVSVCLPQLPGIEFYPKIVHCKSKTSMMFKSYVLLKLGVGEKVYFEKGRS